MQRPELAGLYSMSLRAGWLAGKSKRKHDKAGPEWEEVSPGESCPSCLSWATCQREGCMLGTLAGSISLSGQSQPSRP